MFAHCPLPVDGYGIACRVQRLLTRERATSMGPKKRLKADKNQRKLGFFFSGSEAPVGPTDLSENEAAATDSACVSSDVSSSIDSRSTQVFAVTQNVFLYDLLFF